MTFICPIPHGMGGLKLLCEHDRCNGFWSHPTRDGWIEIKSRSAATVWIESPIPHGMGGLKYHILEHI